MRTQKHVEFFDRLADAIQAARNTDLYIIDGPEDNYAVVDMDTARDLQWDEQQCDDWIPHNTYGFWSVGEAQAYDARVLNLEG